MAGANEVLLLSRWGIQGVFSPPLSPGPIIFNATTLNHDFLRQNQPCGTVFIEDIQSLDHHFSGWTAGEIPYRTPIVALVEDGYPVSVCFCARRSRVAAQAGLETAVEFRGRGLGPRVAAAWALAIRASGRIPLYSTSWSNDASLAVARKLGLVAYASEWSIS